ncbi:hypothetical protein [Nitrobacter sp. TKz-YC02]|uniref:hypothetical protein n=1 Tax=Nitrobacter sp. TKz-YC02 TaxID=3398704 RepID=UPI003CF66AAC
MPTAARRSTRKTASGISLPRFDARTRSSRRYLELVQAFESELGYELTEADRVMVKQAASLSLQAEQIETSVVQGLPVDPDLSIRLTSEVRRILAGLKTKAAKHTPSNVLTPLQYAARKAAEKAAEAADGGAA